MAQDYVILEKNNENGLISINKSVFESIAEISIGDIENAVAIQETRFNKGISVKIDKGQLLVNVSIRVKYGANVNATAELLQNKIYENILIMTGYKVAEVTVNVIGFQI